MFAYIQAGDLGGSDRALRAVAEALGAEGLRIAGAVQQNGAAGPEGRGAMALDILGGAAQIRISQDLGALSRGCRLDPEALERAVGLVEAQLAAGADLLIVNRFGRQEAEGRGFRPTIGAALSAEVPVLAAVGPGYLADFEGFSGGMAEALPAEPARLVAWCRAQLPAQG